MIKMGSGWWVLMVLLGVQLEFSRGYPMRGHDGGSCKEYFPENGVCSEYLGGMMVWEFDGITLQEWDTTLVSFKADILAQTQQIALQDCVDAFMKMVCLTWFPPCTEDNQPRQVCDSVCRHVSEDVCASAYAIVLGIGAEETLPQCDRNVGDPIGDQSFVYWEYLNAWKDSDMFPSVDLVPTCADLTVSKEAACKKKKCLYPLEEYRIPKFVDAKSGLPEWQDPSKIDYCKASTKDSPDDFDCKNCESFCAFPCEPYPEVYSEGEYLLLHVITFVPGFLALPLNILVIWVEGTKLKGMKKCNFTDTFILLSAGLSLVLFFLEPLPSAIFGKEMRCNYEEVYTWEFDLEQEHAVCTVGKLRLHVLQALLFCVVGTLFKVYKQLKASMSMQKYNPSCGSKFFFFFFIIVLPIILASFTYALDADQLYEMSRSYRVSQGGPVDLHSLHTANRLRYAFTCGPRFSNEIIEMFVIHIPLLLAGGASVVLSALLLHIVLFKMGARRSYTKSGKGAKNDALAKLAMNMIRFAIITTILVMINASATALFVPQSVQFGFDLDTWLSCANTGIDYRAVRGADGTIVGDLKAHTRSNMTTLEDFLEHCGQFDEIKPNIILLVLIALSNGLPPVAFGFVFAIPAIKQLRTLLAKKISKITPTTGASTANATSALSES